MKKFVSIITIMSLLLISCGKPKIKTYTIAEKEAYLEKANSGDEETKEFMKGKAAELEKIYKETGDKTAYNEWQQWMRVNRRIRINLPKEKLAW